jgi:hypothetical protein
MGIYFSNQFVGHELLNREHLVSWNIVMVENQVIGPKFRPFSIDITFLLSKFSCAALADT